MTDLPRVAVKHFGTVGGELSPSTWCREEEVKGLCYMKKLVCVTQTSWGCSFVCFQSCHVDEVCFSGVTASVGVLGP